ncbi:hypothetical protein PsorP6_002414 [Peronosclerospora sorghi]|uniref:Uncharacterized protein n=1 Tax=Peronosclerospora sorghi TaxID=230839 RepID=A0ACC0WWY8_9STRA|nr:hypothetical protein PsorP6_002414 [Peronosclerospora sorghi]
MMELMYYCQDTVTLLALGGQSMSGQQALLRDVPDVIVSTPGRLVTHLEAGNLNLKDSVDTVVIDEADLVLSFGYGENIRTIFNALPKACQTFCMSATLSPDLEKLKHSAYLLKLFFEQLVIKSAVMNAKLPHNSRQHIIEEFNRGIFDYLIATDDSLDHDKARNEDETNKDSDIEEDNESEKEEEETTEEEVSKKEQSKNYDSRGDEINKKTVGAKRERADDKSYGVSRGVDFRGVNFVINVDFPKSVRSYTHRIGQDAQEERALKRVQAKKQSVRSEYRDVLDQPAALDFDLKEIDCFATASKLFVVLLRVSRSVRPS